MNWLINRLFQWMLWGTTHFFFGIGQGPSSQELQQYGNLGNIGNFGTTVGEADIASASNFWQSILSGDPSKIATVLGPQMSALNKQGQERKMTLAQFGNRGGGTNAAAQNIDTDTAANINALISRLTGEAGSALGSLGSSTLSTGLSADTAAFNAASVIHGQKANQWNDFFNTFFKGMSAFGGPVGDIGTALQI